MAELDGSIRIGVVFDDKSIKQEMKQVEAAADKASKASAPNDPFKGWNRGTVKEIADAVESYASEIGTATKETNEMLAALEQAKKTVEDLSEKGKFFGDEEYDEAIKKLEIITQNIKNYKKELVSPTPNANPFGLDTIAGKIREAEIKLDTLYKSGKGLGDAEYDEAYRSLALLKEEAKKYRAELETTPEKLQAIADKEAAAAAEAQKLKEIFENAEIGDEYIVGLNQELAGLTARMKELQSAGVGLGYEEYDQISARIKEINDELKQYRANVENAPDPGASKWDKVKQAIKSGFTKSMDSANAAAKKLWGRIKNIGKNRGFDKASKSANKFGDRLKSIVAGALFFNIISKGLSALTKQFGAYLTANKDFSSALSGIKSNLLTAFQPVYDAVLPALTKLMDALEYVTAKFAAFMATIFGISASKAQENAKNLYDQANATKKARKEQEKYLASFDTIEKMGENSADDAGEMTSPKFDTDFSQIEPPQWLMDFWKVFQDSWNQYGATTIQAFQESIGAIQAALLAIGIAFMAVWTGGDGLAVLGMFHSLLDEMLFIIRDITMAFALVWSSGVGEEVLHNLFGLLQMILTIIHNVASAFRTAWNSGSGEAAITAILKYLNSVLKLLGSVGQAFSDAWNDNGRGIQIFETIQGIISHIFEIFGNLAERFKTAWEANENGKRILGAILDIINIILKTFDDIAKVTAEWASELDLEPLMNSIRNLSEKLVPVVQQIHDILLKIWEKIVLPFLSWLTETALPAVVDFLGSILTALEKHPEILKVLTDLVVAFVGAWALHKIINGLSSLLQTANPLVWVLGTLAMLALAIVGAWDDMTGLERAIAVLGILVVAAAAAAIAVGALQSALTLGIAAVAIAAGIAAVVAAVSSATKRANQAGASVPGSYGRGRATAYSSPRMAALSGDIAAYSLSDVPHLAQGAVISPNNEFLAVLGDQRSGTNVEAPLGTIEQALENVFARHGGGGESVDVTVHFTGSLAQVARLLQPEITAERSRLGTNLVGG